MNSGRLIGQVPDANHTAILEAGFSHPIIAGVRESHSNAIEQINLPRQLAAAVLRHGTCTMIELNGTYWCARECMMEGHRSPPCVGTHE